MNENKYFDCNRGCSVTRDKENALECSYKEGCCKLAEFDYLCGIRQEKYSDVFEVRFKNTRKAFYVNNSGQNLKKGDFVIVEAQSGHDVGIVTLEGIAVMRQMVSKGYDPETYQFRRIYRKARPYDMDKWLEATSREQETMVRTREIAASLGLDMKIGDVEFQGDGTKAIFYYIASARVDFRELIKILAEEFHIRVEMKQIGARQESGLIGGIGVCGRELCCARYITNFKSITTAAAKCQDLSLNPQKLAGQCGKLKCCLNYEVANYMDARSQLPKVTEPLHFEDGDAYLVKTDILAKKLYFSYDKNSVSDIEPLTPSQVREIQKMNAEGLFPSTLKAQEEKKAEFISAVGDDSISRFDAPKKRKGGRGRGFRRKGEAKNGK